MLCAPDASEANFPFRPRFDSHASMLLRRGLVASTTEDETPGLAFDKFREGSCHHAIPIFWPALQVLQTRGNVDHTRHAQPVGLAKDEGHRVNYTDGIM